MKKLIIKYLKMSSSRPEVIFENHIEMVIFKLQCDGPSLPFTEPCKIEVIFKVPTEHIDKRALQSLINNYFDIQLDLMI